MGIHMQQAKCPYCQQKLQLPDALPTGTMLQCAGCSNQFLPPAPSSSGSSELTRKKKKARKSKSRNEWTTRSIILVTSLVSIGLLLGTLVLIWLMQPGYGKFNDQLVSQYSKFSEILSSHVNPRPGTDPSTFLKQFVQLGAQFQSLKEETKKIRAPEDQKHLLDIHSQLIESMTKFCQTEVPQYIEEFKKKPNNEATAIEMAKSMYRISTLHESVISGQNSMAMQHGLLQIHPPANLPFFLALNPQRRP
jgi:hypothetical protein